MYNKVQNEVKGRGFMRKTNLGLLCGIALAGVAMMLGGQSVSADEVSTQPSTETAVSPETSANKPNTSVETKPTTEVKPTVETPSETLKATEGNKVVVDNGLTKLASELEALGAPVTKEETEDLGVANTDAELSSLKAKAESLVQAQMNDFTNIKAIIQENEKTTSDNLEKLRKQLGNKDIYKGIKSQLNYLQDEDYLSNKTELTNIVSSKGSVTYANNSKDEVNLDVDGVKANYFSTEGFVESSKPQSIKYSLFNKDKYKVSLASEASPIQDKTHANGIPVFLKEGESVTYDVKFAKDSKMSQLGIAYKRVTVTLKSRGAKETSVPHTLTFLTSHGSSEEVGGISHYWNYKDAISGKPFETEVTYDYFNDKGVKISKEELGAAVLNKIVLKDDIVDKTFFSNGTLEFEATKKESRTYHDYTYRSELGGEHFFKITDQFFSNQGDKDALANFSVYSGEPLNRIDPSLFSKPKIAKVSYHLVSYTDNRNANADPNNPATPKVKGSVVQRFVSDKGIELAKSTSTGEKPEGEALNLTHPNELTYEGKIYVFVKQDKETPNKIVKGEVVVTYTYKEKEEVKGSVTQKFVDDKGKEIANVVKTGDKPEGSDLNLTHPKEITFQGKTYIFVSQDKPDPKKITKGETVVTYTYKEKEQPKPEVKGSVVQKFVSDKGIEIKERTNTGEQKEGSSVSLSHPTEITFQGKTYVFVSQDKPDPSKVVKGEVVVTYTYKEKEQPKPETPKPETPKPTPTVEPTTIFVDEDGKEISPKEKGTQPPKAIEGYEYDSTNPKNKEDKDGETVRVYKKVKYGTVVQRFVDEQGKELQPSVNSGRLKLGSKLELTFPKELTVNKDKYTFKSQDKETPKEVTSEGELVITYVYAKEVAPVVPTTPTETPSKPSTIIPEVKPSVSQPNGVVAPTTESVAKSTLPNTGSGETLSAAIAGLGLLTLVGLSGRRTKED